MPQRSSNRRTWRSWAVVTLGLSVVAAVLVWGAGAWREQQEIRAFVERETLKTQEAQRARDAWLSEHPGRADVDPEYSVRVMTLPAGVSVRSVWQGDQVLLSTGAVLLRDDLLRFHADPKTPLPTMLPALSAGERNQWPALLTLPPQAGAALWSSGQVTGVENLGVSWGNLEPDPYRDEQSIYPYARMLPQAGAKPPDSLNDVVAVAAGTQRTFVALLRRNGQVHAFGPHNSYGQLGPQQPGPDGVPGFVIDDVTAIAAGVAHGLALRRDGTVWMWGQDDLADPRQRPPEVAFQPQLRRVELPPGVVKIAAGNRSSYALTHDGQVWAWGDANCGALGVPQSPVPQERYAGLGQVYGNHRNSILKPALVEGPSQIVDIQAGPSHALALTRTGRVWAWGRNDHGALGTSETLRSSPQGGLGCRNSSPLIDASPELPLLMAGVTDASQIFASATMTAVVHNDRTLWFQGQCVLCGRSKFRFRFYAQLGHDWGHVAAQGMWCGKVEEVTALRESYRRLVSAYAPVAWQRRISGSYQRVDEASDRNSALNSSFLNTAKNHYLAGYDAETFAIRKRAGNSAFAALSQGSDESARWAHALDFFTPGSVVASAPRTAFAVKISPDDDARFKAAHCAGVQQAMQTALAEMARYTETLARER